MCKIKDSLLNLEAKAREKILYGEFPEKAIDNIWNIQLVEIADTFSIDKIPRLKKIFLQRSTRQLNKYFDELLVEDRRICSKCGAIMFEGYILEDDCYYYCSNECLHLDFTDEEWAKTYENNEGYWTVFY